MLTGVSNDMPFRGLQHPSLIHQVVCTAPLPTLFAPRHPNRNFSNSIRPVTPLRFISFYPTLLYNCGSWLSSTFVRLRRSSNGLFLHTK